MRLARCIAPGVVYHVISRFVDREHMLRDHREREKYLHYFAHALERSDWKCISYALMSSHVHLGMIAGEQRAESWLKRVHCPFARWLNERHERLGPVFADRPNAWAVRPENVANLLAYIHNNPVRAGVVDVASASSWTSHRAYTGTDAAPRWLAIQEGLRLAKLAQSEIDVWVCAEPGKDSTQNLAGIRREARKRGAIELGTPTVDVLNVPLVARAFARVRPHPQDVIDMIAALTGVHIARIASRSNDRGPRRARMLSVHTALALGLTASEIGTALGITRQGASTIAKRPLDELAVAAVRLACSRLTTITPSPGKSAQIQAKETGCS